VQFVLGLGAFGHLDHGRDDLRRVLPHFDVMPRMHLFSPVTNLVRHTLERVSTLPLGLMLRLLRRFSKMTLLAMTANIQPNSKISDDPYWEFSVIYNYACNFLSRTSLISFGLPLPCMAFMTWPTRKPLALPSPALIWATMGAWAARTSSTIFSMAPVSLTWARPFSLTT